MLALRLPPDIEERLDDLARKTGRTRSFYAREALLEHLDGLEDRYLAEQRVKEDGPTIPLEAMIKTYGLGVDDEA